MYVIMLHSVGNDKSSWSRRWLSVSLVHFEKLCQHLVKKSYTTHFLDEWYDYFSSPTKKDSRKIVLTFDDGYLDNWVYVYPILKKYGLKGTIFINPEFVEPGDSIRYNLDDVESGIIKREELQALGFLNWPEIQALDASGVMDIQSHSMSHNFYFRSEKIIDVYTGQPHYDWIPWFTHPERKPFYITEDQSGLVPKGYPVFEFGRALGLRRYFPDERIIEKAVQLHTDGKLSRQELIVEINAMIGRYPGRYESDEEMEQRYRYELFESKAILEKKLNKKVDYLCWPGGGYNDLSFRLSVEAGYKASTLGSSSHIAGVHTPPNYKRIERIGLGSFIGTKAGYLYMKKKSYLVQLLKSRTGNLLLRVILKLKKELLKIKNRSLRKYNPSI
jgi:peptidoglycan/xylan/chitin deacetylase (PgdA/CDA1 family)